MKTQKTFQAILAGFIVFFGFIGFFHLLLMILIAAIGA